MPFYEFKCPSCGRKVELLCKMGSTGEELQCSSCGYQGLKKLVSGFCATGVAGRGTSCGNCQSKNCGCCH